MIGLVLAIGAECREAKTKTETKRGPFGFAPIFGKTWRTLNNEFGQAVPYSGTVYGAEFVVTVGEPVALFMESRLFNATHTKYADEKTTGQGYSAGVRVTASDWLYFGLAYGVELDKVKSSAGSDRNVENRAGSASMGVNFWEITASFTMFTQVSYRLGQSRNLESGSGRYNSGLEAAAVTIGIRWSPTVSFTY